MHESAPGQRPERGPAHVGVRPVLQVIEQVQQDDRVAVLAPDLEDPLHRVAPAEQHLPVRRIQVRSAGHEPVHHRLAVRQAVLQGEPVDGADHIGLLRLLQAGLEHGRGQRPLQARAAREVDQGLELFLGQVPVGPPGAGRRELVERGSQGRVLRRGPGLSRRVPDPAATRREL